VKGPQVRARRPPSPHCRPRRRTRPRRPGRGVLCSPPLRAASCHRCGARGQWCGPPGPTAPAATAP